MYVDDGYSYTGVPAVMFVHSHVVPRKPSEPLKGSDAVLWFVEMSQHQDSGNLGSVAPSQTGPPGWY